MKKDPHPHLGTSVQDDAAKYASREWRFAVAYVQCKGNATEAALRVFDIGSMGGKQKSRQTAQAVGSEFLWKPMVQQHIVEIARTEFNPHRAVQRVVEIMEDRKQDMPWLLRRSFLRPQGCSPRGICPDLHQPFTWLLQRHRRKEIRKRLLSFDPTITLARLNWPGLGNTMSHMRTRNTGLTYEQKQKIVDILVERIEITETASERKAKVLMRFDPKAVAGAIPSTRTHSAHGKAIYFKLPVEKMFGGGSGGT